MKRRFFRVMGSLLLFLCAGILYGWFFLHTGIGIPCPIRLVTGLKCPGCGVTHMCAALLRLDFAAAFAANPMVLLLSPLLAVIFLPGVWRYIRTGRFMLGRVQNVMVWICVVLLLLFGIARNVVPVNLLS